MAMETPQLLEVLLTSGEKVPGFGRIYRLVAPGGTRGKWLMTVNGL